MIGTYTAKTEDFLIDINSDFAKKSFTGYELDYCYKRTRPQIHLAGIYCAKRALLELNAVNLNEVEIKHEKSGKPIAFIRKKKFSGDISISHTEKLAIAIAVDQ